uniref:Septin 1 n=1 Tax=Ornithorhynchus anatinus TaxID=9258 RepID=A0A6I8N368_ORNAN
MSLLHQDKEYVGFAALPSQLHRKSVKKGFDFTLMVAGESGLGKSTLINSLFLTDLYKDRELPDASARLEQTLTIERRGVEIEEGGVKVKLTLVDTPGFGDAVDNADCWLPVVRFIEEQFEQYLQDESGLNRKNIQDTRVHCCLYFISPFGRGLRPLDVAFLRAIHEKVNIVPVIGKADALTPAEAQTLKQKIRDQLEEKEISIYQFPDCDSDEDEDFKRQDAEMKVSLGMRLGKRLLQSHNIPAGLLCQPPLGSLFLLSLPAPVYSSFRCPDHLPTETLWACHSPPQKPPVFAYQPLHETKTPHSWLQSSPSPCPLLPHLPSLFLLPIPYAPLLCRSPPHSRPLAYILPLSWNALPPHIRQTNSFPLFNALLNAHLLQEAFPD